MEENKILEFAKSMEGQQGIDAQFSAALNVLQTAIKSNYTNRLQSLIIAQEDEIKKEPPKELALINALSMFANEENKSSLQRVTQIMSTINTFSALRQKLSEGIASPENIYQISSDEPAPFISEKAAKQTEVLLALTIAGLI